MYNWDCDAMTMYRGYTVPINTEAHLRYLIRDAIQQVLGVPDDVLNQRVEETIQNIKRYNKKSQVYHMSVTGTPFGTLLTFALNQKIVRKDGKMMNSGVICWVENLENPQCSELGSCFFRAENNGKIRRVG